MKPGLGAHRARPAKPPGALAIALFVAALGLACEQSAVDGCRTDLECKGDRICDFDTRACVDPSRPQAPADAGAVSTDTGFLDAAAPVDATSAASDADPAEDAPTPRDGASDTGVDTPEVGVVDAANLDAGLPPSDAGGGVGMDASVGGPDFGFASPDTGGSSSLDAGPLCNSYCATARQNCSGSNSLFASANDCQQACDVLQFVQPFSARPGDETGNSVHCRLFWAGEAAMSDPSIACEAASVPGGGVCGSLCEVYCDVTELQCSAPPLWMDPSECTMACAGLPTGGGPTARSGDSVQCRINWAMTPDHMHPSTNCPNSSPMQMPPDGLCF